MGLVLLLALNSTRTEFPVCCFGLVFVLACAFSICSHLGLVTLLCAKRSRPLYLNFCSFTVLVYLPTTLFPAIAGSCSRKDMAYNSSERTQTVHRENRGVSIGLLFVRWPGTRLQMLSACSTAPMKVHKRIKERSCFPLLLKS